MSLSTTTISLEYTSITADRTTIVITDNTTFTSPVRSGLRVYLSGDKMKADNTVNYALTVTGNSTPDLVTSWSVTKSVATQVLDDGWTRFKYAALQAWSNATTYGLYDAVYSGTVVYRSKQAGNLNHLVTDTTWWEVISDPSSLALNKGETNESTNIASLIYEVEVAATAELAFANKIWELSQLSGEADREENVDIYKLLDIWINGLYVADDRSQHPQGEVIARRIESVSQQLGII